MTKALDFRAPYNLRRWQEAGEPQRWVESHQGRWEHSDWTALLDRLRRSFFYWPMDPDAVGRVLEEAKARYWNLRRWRESGEPRRWIAERQGRWGPREREDLLRFLQESTYWPLDLGAAERAVEEAAACYQAVRAWRDSGQAQRWVEEHRGQWNHQDWLDLLHSLRSSCCRALDEAAVGKILEQLKVEWWGLHRWRASGLAWRWTAERHGQWNDDDRRELLESLRDSCFWPLNLQVVQRVLEELRTDWQSRSTSTWAAASRRWTESHRQVLERLRPIPRQAA
jgi:hypothetical protein